MSRKPIEFVLHPDPFPTAMIYRAYCHYVVDGDTFDVLIDKGLNKYDYETLRLKDVDTYELKYPEEYARAVAARKWVEERILNKPLRVQTFKDRETFGRYLANVWFWSNGVMFSLADELRKTTGLVKGT